MSKLESVFLNLLDRRNYHKDELIAETKRISGAEEHKIESRLKKLIDSDKIYLYDGDTISKNSPFEVSETFDERYDYESVTLARKGRVTYIIPKLDSKKQKEKIDRIKLNLPEFKREVAHLLTGIENLIIQSFNPLDILGHTTIFNLACDPETYAESSFKGKQFFVELLHNVVLRHNFNEFPKESDFTKLDELKRLLDNYWIKFNNLIMYEIVAEDNLSDNEKDVLFYTLTHFLFERGQAYPQHIKEIAEELFSKTDQVLLKKGFTIKDYYSTLKEIGNQIDLNHSKVSDFPSRLKEEHDEWLKFLEINLGMGKPLQEIIFEYRQKIHVNREDLLRSHKEFAKIIESPKNIFEIKLNENINKSLLDNLAIGFNSNYNWFSPYDISSVPLKPIIKVEGKYYCFIIQHLIRNVMPIIESLLPYDEERNYSKIKGDYFESKTLELIKNILPTAQIYSKLEYPRRTELDGLVIYDDNLFLVEVKGKKRRCIACAQDILKMTKEDVQEQINKPFEQSKRALEYIKSKEISEFRMKEEGITISVKEKDFKNIFLINVTADSFSEFTTNLNILKSWDQTLLVGDIYPWNVNIYDLLVVTDLLENPNDFIDYISERIRLSKNIDIRAIDELDYLGYYLENGSLTKDKETGNSLVPPMVVGFSENIDRWYSYLNSEVGSAEKPRKNM